jgi:hypothetical protein
MAALPRWKDNDCPGYLIPGQAVDNIMNLPSWPGMAAQRIDMEYINLRPSAKTTAIEGPE